MGECADHKEGRVVLKLVPDYLQHAGLCAHNSERTIDAWTTAAAGLGVRKRDFRKVSVATGRGNAERWAATVRTLEKVWPSLRGTASRKRSR